MKPLTVVLMFLVALMQNQDLLGQNLVTKNLAISLYYVKEKRKRKRFDQIFKYGPPSKKLRVHNLLERVFEDENRNYIKILTNLYAWEFKELSKELKPLIMSARGNHFYQSQCQVDYQHRLYYVLRWLATGDSFRSQEFFTGWSKSSLNLDVRHILRCIITLLKDEITWPNAEERIELANQTTGFFHNVIGIVDVTEHRVQRPGNPVKQRKLYSGKKKYHTYKTTMVIDRNGKIIYCQTGGLGHDNDRGFWNKCPLYLEQGKYFTPGEVLLADDIYKGDGPTVVCSQCDFVDKREEMIFRKCFNTFRVRIENVFARIQQWFPILGERMKKWRCNDDLLFLAVHAAARLHNWLLKTRCIHSNPILSSNTKYKEYY